MTFGQLLNGDRQSIEIESVIFVDPGV